MNDYSLYENAKLHNRNFPIQITAGSASAKGKIFSSHWHEQIELLFFAEGEAIIECNSKPIHAKAGDLIVINGNELHSGISLSENMRYYIIIIDKSLINSNTSDVCEVKYITPITDNLILFKNKIENSFQVTEYINTLVYEYDTQETGYELAVKSLIYQILVFLLRNHVSEVLTPRQYGTRIKNLDRFNHILTFIEDNYSETITIDQLASIVNISTFHFCHLFKTTTGKTASDYVNLFRIGKSEGFLTNTEMNITEIALSVGFNDVNYFCRLFKKYKGISPSEFRKGKKEITQA